MDSFIKGDVEMVKSKLIKDIDISVVRKINEQKEKR